MLSCQELGVFADLSQGTLELLFDLVLQALPFQLFTGTFPLFSPIKPAMHGMITPSDSFARHYSLQELEPKRDGKIVHSWEIYKQECAITITLEPVPNKPDGFCER